MDIETIIYKLQYYKTRGATDVALVDNENGATLDKVEHVEDLFDIRGGGGSYVLFYFRKNPEIQEPDRGKVKLSLVKAVQLAVLIFAGFVISYTVLAFISLESNVFKWEVGMRTGYIILSVLLSGILYSNIYTGEWLKKLRDEF